ncbi:MAG TPA: MBOAT family O-acyltransferase [Clostridia bacterium]|nr:MBOAT family O-acyltransferase [Clostridia bacterium]
MSFNSLPYLIFIICVCLLHYLVRPKYRNTILLAASYFFYVYIDPRYSVFLIFSTLMSYMFARLIQKDIQKRKKFWFIISILVSIGLLVIVKYLGFFTSSISSLLANLQLPVLPNLNIIVPIGISFYSFTVTGYLIDVYRNKVTAEKNIIDYALFVSFFPQLLSGPIERASNMLFQYKRTRKFSFENLKTGMIRFLWGLFKKMIIADQLAIIVNNTYSVLPNSSSLNVIIAIFAFSLQIYIDFSAYSDMALGSAKLLGLDIMENFDSPYLSSSVRNFWRRWHISLTSWFKDYLYIPLGGSRCSNIRHLLNIFIVFAISGLWHGASFTFLIWGIINGIYLIIGQVLSPVYSKIKEKVKINENNRLFLLIKGVFTFMLISFSWIFFRSEDIEQAFLVIKKGFTSSQPLLNYQQIGISLSNMIVLGASLLLLSYVDVFTRKNDLISEINKKLWLTYAICLALIISVLIFGVYGPGYDPIDFVYFKF